MENIKLQKIIKENVCSYCGGKLDIAQINGYNHCVCNICSKIEYGVKPKIYNLAKRYMDERNFNYYNHLYDDKEYCKKLNMSILCSIVNFVISNKESI